jgi:hypothetical protein
MTLILSNSKLKKSTMPMSISAQQQNHILSFRKDYCRNCTNQCFPQCTESWNMSIAWLLLLSNSKLKKSTKPMSLSFSMSLSLCSLTKSDLLFQKGPIAENWANPCFPQWTESWKHENLELKEEELRGGGEVGIVVSLPTVRTASFSHWSGRHGALL